MWLFTKYGFYSAVCARQGDGSHGQPVDPSRVMVRARVRGHLQALRTRFKDLLGECEILESKGTDYAFRVFVAKSIWSQVLQELGKELDYDNFKSEATDFQENEDAAYVHSLHDVWSIMNQLQS